MKTRSAKYPRLLSGAARLGSLYPSALISAAALASLRSRIGIRPGESLGDLSDFTIDPLDRLGLIDE